MNSVNGSGVPFGSGRGGRGLIWGLVISLSLSLAGAEIGQTEPLSALAGQRYSAVVISHDQLTTGHREPGSGPLFAPVVPPGPLAGDVLGLGQVGFIETDQPATFQTILQSGGWNAQAPPGWSWWDDITKWWDSVLISYQEDPLEVSVTITESGEPTLASMHVLEVADGYTAAGWLDTLAVEGSYQGGMVLGTLMDGEHDVDAFVFGNIADGDINLGVGGLLYGASLDGYHLEKGGHMEGVLTLSDPSVILDVDYGDTEAGFQGTAAFDRYVVTYEKLGDAGSERTLSVVKDGLEILNLDGDRMDTILDGDFDLLKEVYENDLQGELDSETRWGDQDQYFFRFDQASRLFESNVDDHDFQLRLGTGGYLALTSNDGRFQFRANKPHAGRIDLPMARVENDFMTLDFGQTHLQYDRQNPVLGLYGTGQYIMEVYSDDPDAVEMEAKRIWNEVGDYGLDDQHISELILGSLEEIKVNARELSKGYVQFSDSRLNTLLSSLAWDIEGGVVALSDQDIVDVLEAEDSGEALYELLDGLLPDTPDILQAPVRTLSYEMGMSIIEPRMQSPSGDAAIPRFSQPATVSFAGTEATQFSLGEGFVVGYDAVPMNVQLPLFGKYSRTSLGLRTVADRYYLHGREELWDTDEFLMSVDGLAYAYRFPEQLTLDLSDGYARRFSVNDFTQSLISFQIDQDEPKRVIIPGLLLGTTFSSPRDGWYGRLQVMPYLPLRMDGNGLSVNLDAAESGANPLGLLGALGWATDVRGGITTSLLGREARFEVGKDVTDSLQFSSSVDVLEPLTLGLQIEGPDVGTVAYRTYRAELDLFGYDSQFFVEENLVSKTDIMGVSVGRRVDENIYNVSASVASWDNAGIREVYETSFSVGADLNGRTQVLGSISRNAITETVTYRNSWNIALSEDGANSWIIEGSVLDAANGFESDIRTLLRFEL